ncbi:UNVERIFIED_ORG: hypothetical protein QOE_2117 [Clostridioides difficile F501]
MPRLRGFRRVDCMREHGTIRSFTANYTRALPCEERLRTA